MAVSGTGLSTLIASKLENILILIEAADKGKTKTTYTFALLLTVLSQMMCHCVCSRASWHTVTTFNGKLKCDRFQFAK